MSCKRILIAEDEECMRESLELIFTAEGYDTVMAVDGADAFTKFNEAYSAAPIDLLITDSTMPGLTGPELMNQVVYREPFLPIIMISGYDEIAAMESRIVAGTWELLHKPFGRHQLVDAVHRAFDKAATIKKEMHQYEVINSLIRIEQEKVHCRGRVPVSERRGESMH